MKTILRNIIARFKQTHACRLPVGDTAGCQPALRRGANPPAQILRHSDFGLLLARQSQGGGGSDFGFRISGFGLIAAAGFLAITALTARGQSDYATPYTFVTLAGSFGTNGFADGTNGTAEFYFPEGLAVDTNDNVYVVDNGYNTVRKLALLGTNWVVTTIAGNTNYGGSANGTYPNSLFSEPTAIALDGVGNLYVTDAGNNTLRKLAPVGANWVSTTLAGSVGITGGQNGTNNAAHFNYPCGLAVDQTGNLFVADTYNDTIRRVVHTGTNWVVTTIAGMIESSLSGPSSADGTNQAALFDRPCGIAVDQGGNVYVADSGNYTIRKLSPVGTNWVVTTIAGTAGNGGSADGTNGDASFLSSILDFGYPMGLAVDAQTNLYVADVGNGEIRKVSPVGTNWVTTTLAGSDSTFGNTDGTGAYAVFSTPSGLAVDPAGNLFVSDPTAYTMREGSLAVAPNLSLSLTGVNSNSVLLSWPALGTFSLQTNANLTAPNWGYYGGAVTNASGTNCVTVSPSAPALYFRLAY